MRFFLLSFLIGCAEHVDLTPEQDFSRDYAWRACWSASGQNCKKIVEARLNLELAGQKCFLSSKEADKCLHLVYTLNESVFDQRTYEAPLLEVCPHLCDLPSSEVPAAPLPPRIVTEADLGESTY